MKSVHFPSDSVPKPGFATKIMFVIELKLKSYKDPIYHYSDTRGSYDNRHFYIVYCNKTTMSNNTIYSEVHRYPVHTIEKITETAVEVDKDYEINNMLKSNGSHN